MESEKENYKTNACYVNIDSKVKILYIVIRFYMLFCFARDVTSECTCDRMESVVFEQKDAGTLDRMADLTVVV